MIGFVIIEAANRKVGSCAFISIAGVPLVRRQFEVLKNFPFCSVFIAYDDGKAINLKDILNNQLDFYPVKPNFIPLSGLNEFVLKTRNPLILSGDNCFFDADCLKNCFAFVDKHADDKCFILGDSRHIVDALPGKWVCITEIKGFFHCINSFSDIERIENFLYSGLTSSTDSWLTRKINRRISIAITKKLSRYDIHPNVITLINFCIGLFGAYLIGRTGYFSTLFGTVFFLASSVLDGCDGELARLKFQKSRLGGYLDVVTDNIVHWFLFLSITVLAVRKSGIFPYLPFGVMLIASSVAAFVLSFVIPRIRCGPKGLLFSENTLSVVTGENEIVDKMANRDFAYLLVVLALFDRVEWFLLVGGPGSLVFACLLYNSFKRKGIL